MLSNRGFICLFFYDHYKQHPLTESAVWCNSKWCIFWEEVRFYLFFNKNSSLCCDAPLGLLCSVCKILTAERTHQKDSKQQTQLIVMSDILDKKCLRISFERGIVSPNIRIQIGPHIKLLHLQMNLIQLCPSLSNTQGNSRSSVSHLYRARSPPVHKSNQASAITVLCLELHV